MASEYRTALPGEKELAAEIERTRAMLEHRKRITLPLLGGTGTKAREKKKRNSRSKKGRPK
jgi:hypothetical protein